MNPVPFTVALALGLGGYLFSGINTGVALAFGWLCFLVVFNVIAGVRS